MIKRVIDGFADLAGKAWRFGRLIAREAFRTKMISVPHEGEFKGRVLITYMLEAMLLDQNDPKIRSHTNFIETFLMVQTLTRLGYDVDVVYYRDKRFRPRRRYDIFVGTRQHFDRIAKHLDERCLKIAYMDMAHWLSNNLAVLKRLKEVQKKKGVVLQACKLKEENRAAEGADAIVTLGNEYTLSTFAYSGTRMFRVRLPSHQAYPLPEKKNFETARRNFLWFGGSGMVHKGLDLVLEAFQELPDHTLYVCGPIHEEPDFERAYFQELYSRNNVKTIGWLDTGSERFLEMMNEVVGVICPSCSEAGCGAVITCMQAGVIPIVSYETSVDVEADFGILLNDLSAAAIQRAVEEISGQSSDRLRKMSRKAWQFAREHHSRSRFSAEFREVIETLAESRAASGSGKPPESLERLPRQLPVGRRPPTAEPAGKPC